QYRSLHIAAAPWRDADPDSLIVPSFSSHLATQAGFCATVPNRPAPLSNRRKRLAVLAAAPGLDLLLQIGLRRLELDQPGLHHGIGFGQLRGIIAALPVERLKLLVEVRLQLLIARLRTGQRAVRPGQIVRHRLERAGN